MAASPGDARLSYHDRAEALRVAGLDSAGDRSPPAITRERLDAWLRSYGEAWESRDGEAAGRLFAEDALYHWGPYDPPLAGKKAIRERWSRVTAGQTDVRFRHEVLGIDDDRGFARWWSSYVYGPERVRQELDGVFVLDFGDDGLCRQLQEWWLTRETPAD